jgi:2-keto-4-pentenoate hydratase
MTESTPSSAELAAIAVKLRNAMDTGIPIAPIRSEIGQDNLAAAYKIQRINTAHGCDQGRVICGRKIGLTSAAVQVQLGVDQPDFGVLFSDMARTDFEDIDIQQMIAPRIEAEMVFVVGKDINHPGLTMADLLRSIEYLVPALEIVDSRVQNWDIGITDTVADNASCGLFVLGSQKRMPGELDLRSCGMVMEDKSGPVSFGAGAACMGNPLNACLWLAKKMIEFETPLSEGDIILSGALGPMVNVRPGDSFQARIGNIGSVAAHFRS